MKTSDKIHIVLITVALAFWNPISFYLIYADTELIHLKISNLICWIVTSLGIVIIILIIKNKINDFLKNVFLSLAFFGIIFSLVVFIDRGIGLFLAKGNMGLIFEPNSKARYQTPEFDYAVEINSIGLRDREVEINKGDKYRILCFGDSWTLGWGVDIKNSWPKKLEDFLVNKGFDNIEVINCGQSGQYTTVYKKQMERAIPLLKPDLVLVGVLQGENIVRLYEEEFLHRAKTNKINIGYIIIYLKDSFQAFIEASFHNSLKIVKKIRSRNTIDIHQNWQSVALDTISNLNGFDKLRYQSIDNTIKDMFETGNLSPGLINEIRLQEKLLIANDPYNAATLCAINEMKKDFEQMKIICDKYDAKLIFLNLPLPELTGHNVIRTPALDILNNYASKNNRIDSIYKSVALHVNIPYFELTERFKKLSDKSSYFFKYDGHPNENGYAEMAKGIGEYLIIEYNLESKIKKE